MHRAVEVLDRTAEGQEIELGRLAVVAARHAPELAHLLARPGVEIEDLQARRRAVGEADLTRRDRAGLAQLLDDRLGLGLGAGGRALELGQQHLDRIGGFGQLRPADLDRAGFRAHRGQPAQVEGLAAVLADRLERAAAEDALGQLLPDHLGLEARLGLGQRGEAQHEVVVVLDAEHVARAELLADETLGERADLAREVRPVVAELRLDLVEPDDLQPADGHHAVVALGEARDVVGERGRRGCLRRRRPQAALVRRRRAWCRA